MRDVNIKPQSWAVEDQQDGDVAEFGETETAYSFSYARA